MFQKHSKLLSILILCSFFSSLVNPFYAQKTFAQALPTETGNDAASSALFPSGNSGQATGNVQSGTSASEVSSGAALAVGEAVGTCSVGGLLGSIVSNYLKIALGSITSKASDYVSSAIGSQVSKVITIIPRVPVADDYVSENTARLVDKEHSGGQGSRYDIVSGLAKGFIQAPSFDAFGFCLGNAIIRYIGDATVQWIRSGFVYIKLIAVSKQPLFKEI